MKILRTMLACAVVLLLTACSGGYSHSACEQLKEKMQNHEQLTESDYNTMVDQLVICAKTIKEKVDDAKGNQEKEDALRNDTEFTDMMGYCMIFGFYLDSHKKDLSEDNIKKVEEASQELKSLN